MVGGRWGEATDGLQSTSRAIEMLERGASRPHHQISYQISKSWNEFKGIAIRKRRGRLREKWGKLGSSERFWKQKLGICRLCCCGRRTSLITMVLAGILQLLINHEDNLPEYKAPLFLNFARHLWGTHPGPKSTQVILFQKGLSFKVRSRSQARAPLPSWVLSYSLSFERGD